MRTINDAGNKVSRKGGYIILLALAFGLIYAGAVQAQVGSSISVDGTPPNDNAMLDVQSPATGAGKGLLIPRITLAQRTTSSAALAGGLLDNSGNLRGGAAQGLIVYQTDGVQGLYFNTSLTATPAWSYLGDVTGFLASNVWAAADSTTNYLPGTTWAAAGSTTNYLPSNVWAAAGSTTNYLPRTGGTMSGALNMGAQVVTNVSHIDFNGIPVSVGREANGSVEGAAMGHNANGSDYSAAVGAWANGSDHGAAMGYGANGTNRGAAMGLNANGSDHGAAVGMLTDGSDRGAAVGYNADGSDYGVAMGRNADGSKTNVAIGMGATAKGGTERIAIGHCVTNNENNTTCIRGDLYLDGGSSVYTNGGVFGSGAAWNIKAFTIDHPLDPANKVLRHFCMEGPQVWNVYAGNAQLKNGQAVVELPNYYSALNLVGSEIYSLTAISSDRHATAVIEQEVINNRFVIGGSSDIKVSWTIKVLRNDPGCLEDLRRRPVEQLKSELQ